MHVLFEMFEKYIENVKKNELESSNLNIKYKDSIFFGECKNFEENFQLKNKQSSNAELGTIPKNVCIISCF